jgi:tetratricopeptide (TPR) repeat protein
MTKVRVILLGGLILVGLICVHAMTGCRSAHTTSAILYIDEQQYQKAVDVLHEGLNYNPDEPDAYFWLGEAHSKLAEVAINDNKYAEAKQNYELAYQYYQKAKELDPEHFTEQANNAMQHNYVMRSRDAKNNVDAGYYEQAEGQYRLAHASLPDSIVPIKNIARMKMRMAAERGNDQELLSEALQLLDVVLEVRPEAYELLWDKANVLTELGRTDESQVIYDELIMDHGDDSALLIDIANLAVERNDFEQAADLYIKIAGIYQSDSDVGNDSEVKDLLVKAGVWLGYENIGRYQEALQLFDRALQLEPIPSQETQLEYMRTYYNYGEFLRKQAEGETDALRKSELAAQARAQFSRGVEVGNALVAQYPSYPYGFYYLALCHTALGDAAAAELNIKRFDDLQQASSGG